MMIYDTCVCIDDFLILDWTKFDEHFHYTGTEETFYAKKNPDELTHVFGFTNRTNKFGSIDIVLFGFCIIDAFWPKTILWL